MRISNRLSAAPDSVALVTGASSGIGRAIALALSGRGVAIAMAGRDHDLLEDTRSLLATGSPSTTLRVDVRDEDSVANMVESISNTFGRLDMLFNAAGVYEGLLGHELDVARWQDVMDTNLTGPFICSRAALPLMIGGGGGAIVNVGSVAGVSAGAGGVAYTAAKHGLVGLTRQLAMQYGHHGIRVNCVNPGMVATRMTAATRSSGERDEFVAMLPAGRWATPDEVARVAVFLASSEAAYVTGADWAVDGGFTLGHFRGGATSPTGG